MIFEQRDLFIPILVFDLGVFFFFFFFFQFFFFFFFFFRLMLLARRFDHLTIPNEVRW